MKLFTPWVRRRIGSYALIAPALVLLVGIYVYPAIYNLWLSLRDVSLFQLAAGGDFIGFRNYVEVLGDPLLRRVVFNTVFWLTAGTVLVRLALGLGIALMINGLVVRRWRLTALVRTLMMIPWIVPPVIAVAIWTWMLQPRYGLVNQVMATVGLGDGDIAFLSRVSTVWPAISTIVVWRELPLVVLMYLAGLQSIPGDLYEAARVDGAKAWQSVRYITIPMLRPVTAIVALLTTIWTFNNFVYVWLTTGGGPGNYTQVFATYLFRQGFVTYEVGKGAAIGVLMTGVMAMFAIVYFWMVVRPGLDEG